MCSFPLAGSGVIGERLRQPQLEDDSEDEQQRVWVWRESFEQLAYEAALRSLDKQERLLEELRARTGVLLAGSSIAATVVGGSTRW